MRYFSLILLMIAALLAIAVNYMGALTGVLYFACAALSGIFAFLVFCAIKASLEDDEINDYEDWF